MINFFDFTSLLQQNPVTALVGAYFMGITLSALPCNYPLLPILANILQSGGQNQANTLKQKVITALLYIQGLSLIYVILGLLSVLLGKSVSIFLQNPYALGSFAILLFLMGLNTLDKIKFSLPNNWSQAWDKKVISLKKPYLKAFLMGILSGLVVGPCMTGPLVAVLTFVSRSQSYFLGAGLFYFLALGLGTPLLLVSLFFKLPKPGVWMNRIKITMAWLLFFLAIWTIQSFLSTPFFMVCCSLWLLSYLIYADFLQGSSKSIQFFGFLLLFLCFGLVIKAYFLAHYPDIFSEKSKIIQLKQNQVRFEKIKVAQLKSKLTSWQQEKQVNQIVLDAYADWCIACKEFEHQTLPALTDFMNQDTKIKRLWVTVDMTEVNSAQEAFLKDYEIFGPPSFIIINLHTMANEKKSEKPIVLQGNQSLETLTKALMQ